MACGYRQIGELATDRVKPVELATDHVRPVELIELNELLIELIEHRGASTPIRAACRAALPAEPAAPTRRPQRPPEGHHVPYFTVRHLWAFGAGRAITLLREFSPHIS
ncbi:hypothetical protein [Micromonospora sp. NPDC005979]|uniref:hypothetical protein n=1 Tax=Micromonospora sp. NPDC005979 TaxID=3156726 RepID=UPI0033A03005